MILPRAAKPTQSAVMQLILSVRPSVTPVNCVETTAATGWSLLDRLQTHVATRSHSICFYFSL